MSPTRVARADLPRPPDPQLDPAGYLRSLGAVRERAKIVLDKTLTNKLHHFDVDMQKFPDAVTFVSNLIKVRCRTQLHGIVWHGRRQALNLKGSYPKLINIVFCSETTMRPST